MKMKSVAFHTLGCKVNRYETDAVAGSFAKAGYIVKDFNEKCDVYVINTCTVTNEADRKSKQFIRRAKKINPDAITIAMGCHVELGEGKEYADILIGNRNKMDAVLLSDKLLSEKKENKSELVQLKLNFGASEHLLKNIEDEKHIFEDMGYVTSRDETRAFIKIEDGCNNFCSYCAIPLARGRVRSRDENSIIEEARQLAEKGFKEIVFTGIHVCSYTSVDNATNSAVIDLAGKISKIEGIERIRLGSLEPYSINQEFVEKMSEISQICPHFHISLQSGSDNVLKMMNRKYATSDYRKVIDLIKSYIKEPTFTTDIITGFPGETDSDHINTLEFCKEINFLDMHIFKFSKRKGTKAEKMKFQVESGIINERSKDLIDLAQKMRINHFSGQVNKTASVLIEKHENGKLYGYTDNYFPVIIPFEIINSEMEKSVRGEIFDIYIDNYDNETLIGKFI